MSNTDVSSNDSGVVATFNPTSAPASTSMPTATATEQQPQPSKGPSASSARTPKPPTDVVVSLFAPSVEHVFVVGSWNGGEATPMERGEDGTWRVTVPLADGRYTYRFRTKSRSWFQPGKEVDFVDPQAREIERREDGEWGVLSVRGGRHVTDRYRWRNDATVLPRDRELVIYELHVGDFSGGPGDEGRGNAKGKGRFADVIAKLPYLKDLGINAIELMPVAAGPEDYDWGYIPRHFFAPNPAYGSPTDLKKLVDACHAQGIRVLADMVCNHANVDTPLAQIDHDYWFYHTPPEGEETYGPKFNLDQGDPLLPGTMPARKFLNEMLLYWTDEYHLDGIRFDATKLINNFDFLGWIGARLKEEMDSKSFLLIAEHLPVDPSVVGYNGPVDSAWHDPFYFYVTATLRGQEYSGCQPFDEGLLKGIDPALEGFEGPRAAVQYLENHDHDRLLYSLAQAGVEGEEALRRATVGATLLLTAVGIPMIYHGGEFGMNCAKTPAECKLNWASLAEEPRKRLREHYQQLVTLRERTAALHSGHLEVMAFEPEWHRLAYRRWASEHQGGGEVIVLANLGDADITDWEVPNWPARGSWREVIAGQPDGHDGESQGGEGQVIEAGAEGPAEGDGQPVGTASVRVDVPRWSARLFLHEAPTVEE